jgi:hypothetical protein
MNACVVKLQSAVSGLLLASLLAGMVLAGAPVQPRHPDFTGLWQIASLESVKRSGEYDENNLTPKAKAARAFFQAHSRGFEDQAVAHCVPHGLPWAMTSPARDYMHDIYQTRDRITILFEGMEVYRVIHLNQTAVPEGFTSGTWGYSIGHWEGDTLVIVTTHLSGKNPFSYNQRSDQAVVTERWRLLKDPKLGDTLDLDIIIDDPVNFIKPSHGHELLVRGGPDAVLLPYGCTESLWNDYADRRLEEIAKEEGKKP